MASAPAVTLAGDGCCSSAKTRIVVAPASPKESAAGSAPVETGVVRAYPAMGIEQLYVRNAAHAGCFNVNS